MLENIIDIILEYVEPDEAVTADSKLRKDCGLSSFDMVCCVDEISAEYNISLNYKDFSKCSTVGDLVAVIEAAVAAK